MDGASFNAAAGDHWSSPFRSFSLLIHSTFGSLNYHDYINWTIRALVHACIHVYISEASSEPASADQQAQQASNTTQQGPTSATAASPHQPSPAEAVDCFPPAFIQPAPAEGAASPRLQPSPAADDELGDDGTIYPHHIPIYIPSCTGP